MIKNKILKILIAIIYFVILFSFLWYLFKNFNLKDFSSFDIIKSNRDLLEEIKNKNIILSALIFFTITVCWTILLGFGTPIFLIGGFIFGKWLGTILVVFGLTIGASILYTFANYFLKGLIYDRFNAKYSYLVEKFKKNELVYFAIYRAIGGIPFFIQNLLPIIFNIKLKNYFFGSLIGMTPQLFIGVSLGAGINKIIDDNTNMPSIFDMILAPDIYFPISGLIIIFIVALLFRKKFFRK